MAKALTPDEITALCETLKAKDIEYASKLDIAQDTFLKTKPRIKNWPEFKLVQDIKTAMLSLHSPVDDVSVKVNGIEVTFVRPNKG